MFFLRNDFRQKGECRTSYYNPRIHAGQALVVPYIEFISRSKNGTPVASSAYVYRSRIKTNGSPLVEETFYDKLAKRIEEINLEKLAERPYWKHMVTSRAVTIGISAWSTEIWGKASNTLFRRKYICH